jgi:hypothetical protein
MLVPDVSASRKVMKPKNKKLSIEDKVEGRAIQEEEDEGGLLVKKVCGRVYIYKYVYIYNEKCMYICICMVDRRRRRTREDYWSKRYVDVYIFTSMCIYMCI